MSDKWYDFTLTNITNDIKNFGMYPTGSKIFLNSIFENDIKTINLMFLHANDRKDLKYFILIDDINKFSRYINHILQRNYLKQNLNNMLFGISVLNELDLKQNLPLLLKAKSQLNNNIKTFLWSINLTGNINLFPYYNSLKCPQCGMILYPNNNEYICNICNIKIASLELHNKKTNLIDYFIIDYFTGNSNVIKQCELYNISYYITYDDNKTHKSFNWDF